MQEYGSDLDLIDNNGQTPLYYCIKTGKIDTCEFLLKNGARVNHQDKRGLSPFGLAKKSQKQAVQELLIKYGAQVPGENK
jgi:ankyrin repeat protein